MGRHIAHKRLRILLLAAILAVSGLTLSSFLQRRRRRADSRPLPAKIAADVDQQTQTFSLSKTAGGKPLYTVQASQVTNFKDTGKTLLHNVSILIFGPKGERRDRITSQECEYDQAKSTLFIPGDLEMQLEAPPPSGGPAGKQEPSGPIHVFTSGLSFDQNTGIAATENQVRFRLAQGEGSSQGAVYNPQEETVVLKSQVQFTFWKTPLPDALGNHNSGSDEPSGNGSQGRAAEADSTHIQAGSLRFQRNDRKIYLAGPVEIVQNTRAMEAGNAEILLDQQQRAQSVSLSGGVHGTDRNPGQLSDIRAARSDVELTPQGKVRKIVLNAGAAQSGTAACAMDAAVWATATLRSRKDGRACQMQMEFQPETGTLERVQAAGHVRVVLSPIDGLSGSPLLSDPKQRQEDLKTPAAGAQIMSADDAEMTLAGDGETLRDIRTHSASRIELLPAKTSDTHRTIDGEAFLMQFNEDGNLSEFSADKNVHFSEEGSGPKAAARTSSSDHLWAAVDAQRHSVTKMRQWGNFRYQDAERQARSEEADYTADGNLIVLQGDPLLWNSTGKLAAIKISLRNASAGSGSDVAGDGRVATTYFPNPTPGDPTPEPIHVVADHLQYNSRSGVAIYEGNARMWQGSDVIEAGRLEMNRLKQQMEATGGVSTILPGNAGPDALSPPSPRNASAHAGPAINSAARSAGTVPVLDTSGPVEIHSAEFSYNEQKSTAHYQGNVRMQNPSATMTSSDLDILFDPPPSKASGGNSQAGRRIKQAIANGNVVITEPTRKATGDRAEYFPAEQKMVLFGKVASVTDEQRGTTQGARLTYFTGDGTILVQSEPGSPAETRRQVRH